MHPKILRAIATGETDVEILERYRVAGVFTDWLAQYNILPDQKKITVAGKNYGSFDRQFLERLPGWKENVLTKHRTIDPGSLLLYAGSRRRSARHQDLHEAGRYRWRGGS